MKIRFTTELLSLVVLTATLLSSPATFAEAYPDPDPSWLRAALNEPFKREQVSGQANGYDVNLDRAQIQPYREGDMQVLSLMQVTKSGMVHNLHVWLPYRESLEGKTIYFPCKQGENEGEVTVWREVGDTQHGGGGGTGAKHICGRITFGQIQKNKLQGYICLRFGSNACKQSYLNGYFYATVLTTPKMHPGNMYK
jgi:hypothetical protein